MTYLFIYLILFPLLFLIVKPYPQLHKIPFFVVFLFSLLRYDTTSDYLNYVRIFYDVQEGFIGRDIEPVYILLSKIFSFYEYGYILVFMIFTTLSYYFIYKILSYYNIIYWGSFFFVILQFPFMFDNIVRQSVSIALFAYSIQYIFTDKKKYIVLNIIGVCFHYSAFVCILLYPLILFFSKININKYFAVAIILLLFVFYKMQVNEQIVKYLLLLTPYSNYSLYIDLFKSETNSGLIILLKAIIYISPLFIIKNNDDKFVKLIINMSFFTACLYLFSVSFVVINRLMVYFYLFIIFAYSYLFLSSKYKKYIFLIVPLFLFQYVNYVVGYYGTNNIYYTFFSDRCKEHLYYQRVRELGDSDKKLLSDREILYQYIR